MWDLARIASRRELQDILGREKKILAYRISTESAGNQDKGSMDRRG